MKAYGLRPLRIFVMLAVLLAATCARSAGAAIKPMVCLVGWASSGCVGGRTAGFVIP